MINILDIKVGERLLLQSKVVAEVVENMEDGQWLMVRYVAVPSRPEDVGKEELCHSQDIVKRLPPDTSGM
jgi:hypothetical protein